MPEPPRRSFTTHGEPDAAEAMAAHIRERFGWRVDAPRYGEQVVRNNKEACEGEGAARL